MTAAPEAVLIAGANGAGKTTFAGEYLSERYPGAVFLNADEIQHEGGEVAHPVTAGRKLISRLTELVAERRTFVVETTLSSRNYVRKLRLWNADGYRTSIHFIEVPSADFAVGRVARRVAAGGHAVPEVDVRRRYERGVTHFLSVYQSLVDHWYHWRCSNQGLRIHDSKPH